MKEKVKNLLEIIEKEIYHTKNDNAIKELIYSSGLSEAVNKLWLYVEQGDDK